MFTDYRRYIAPFFGGNVLNYRVYCFDGLGKVWTAEWIEASTDEEAIQAIRTMDVGIKCELWEGKRLVAVVDAKRGIARPGRFGGAAPTFTGDDVLPQSP
jgi:hypothetical protein